MITSQIAQSIGQGGTSLPSRRTVRVFLLVVGLALLQAPAQIDAAQIECHKVISAIAREKRSSAGGATDLSKLGKEMGTSIAWIEHCMRTYGRRPRRPGLESAEGRENRLEALEIFEPEEPIESEDRGVMELPRIPERQPKIRAKRRSPSSSGDD